MIERTALHSNINYRIHIRSGDVLAFIALFSTIDIGALGSVLPHYSIPVLRLICLVFLLIYYIWKKEVPDSCSIMWGVFMLWCCFCNLVNSQSILAAVYNPMKVALFVALNKIYLKRRDKTLLKMTRHYFLILLVINFVIQMVDQDLYGYTNSMNYVNFFQSDNYLGWYYIPYVAICVVLDFIEKEKLRTVTYLEIALCLASIVRAWAGKTLIGLFLIVFYLIFMYRKKLSKLLTPKLLLVSCIAINIGFLFFSMQSLVSASIYDILKKDGATLSGRTMIWAAAINNIRKSPVFGYGVPNNGELFINRIGLTTFPAHNIFLEVAVQTGTVGLALYCLMLAVSLYIGPKRIKKILVTETYRYEYLFLCFITFVIFTMAMMSHPVYIPFLYLPIILISSFDAIVDMHEMERGFASNHGEDVRYREKVHINRMRNRAGGMLR